MPDVFIALEEAAAFESVSYKTLTQRIYRNPQQYKTKSQAREGGGKDQVLISTSSLSAKARKAWRAAQKVEGSEVIIDKRAQEAVPWYVTADLNQYTEANKKRFYEAVELAARVQDFIDYDGPDRTGYAERYALGLGISPQSLYRYMKNVLEANAWALKLEKEDGKSRDYFRALALCRKPKETGTFPSLTDEQKAIIENIWFDKRFAANLGTIEMLYERFELEAERREWEEYPSIKTVARYIKFLMGQRGAESARFLAANGTREWKNKRMMKGKRDATSLQVMEYVVGDEHTFDFWVQWTAPNGKIKAVRPKLVAWLDMRSRAIIGDVACVNANSQTLKESLVKMIYSNPGGVPHILHVDNGKDYTAKAMTGQNRKHRKIDLDFAFDSETVGFYQSIGIQEVGRSLPYQPWDKPIERFFSTVCSKFSKWFESYTGTLTGSKTYAKRQKDIDQMLERGELLTMEEFFEVWTEWKNTKYHTRKHRGLSDAGEKWVTPIELFENGPRYSDLSDMEFGEMFSAGISDAVRAFKTSGSGMAQAIQNLGASATTAQVPLEEQLSVLGMLQATMGGAEAGTKYKAFLRSATKGGEALGLKFTDANNQLLSMPEILDILRGKFGETMDAAEKMELQKAFGDTEAVALIDLMYNKVGDLQDNIVNMYGSLGKGVSVTEQMASAIQETEPERFERLKQRIHNVTESIGNSLLPTVNDLMSKGEGVLTKVGSWIEKNQELVKVIMLIVLAVGGFLAVGGTLIALISGVGLVVTKTVSAFKILKGGFALARGALTPLISSVWSFTAALLANPVTWVVIGIVALIAALVLLYNKCEWFRNAVNSVINFFKGTLTAVGSVAKSVFEGIGNVIGSVMDAAKATVSEKLSNIKTAYEEHGGGISGVAAAAMEAVKGWYTAGYTFIDNLTGGKLSEIREKFSTAMSNIVQGISQKFTDARTAFSNGLNNIKNAVSGAVTWFFESGKRIVSTFANGIKSAFSSAVEAVKGGLQKIRNLLPFSDAKEGPLSTLTLSGQRTMTTYAHGLTLAGDAPAEAMNKSLQQVQGALDRKPEKKIDLGGGKKDKDESSDEGGSGKGKQVIIHKLLVPVDLKKIKDLQQLLALLQEVEDYAAANEDGEPGDDEDAAPAPA